MRSRVRQPGDVSGLADAEDLIPVADTEKAAADFGEAAKIAASTDLTVGFKSALDAAQNGYQGIGVPSQVPAMEVGTGKESVTAETPESPETLSGYMVAQGTVAPAPLNGVYCRGGACQYRVTPPPLGAPTLPPLPVPGELCRGLGCPPPAQDLKLLTFMQNCQHVFVGLGGGLPGGNGAAPPTIGDVRATFESICKKYVPLEACSCSSYADVFVGALAPIVREPSVGNVREACQHTYFFVENMKGAEVDLGILPGSAPPSASSSLLEVEGNTSEVLGNPFDRAEAGPCTPRGQRWRQWVEQRQKEHNNLGLMQETPRVENAPCAAGYAMPKPAAMKFTIAPACAAGLPPAEVDGDIYQHCSKQMAEIMVGGGRAAPDVVTLTEQWCGWQSMSTSLSDDPDKQGRPDWDQRTCKRMANLVAFALRNDLESKAGQGPQMVCKKLFIATGLVQRVGKLVNAAYDIGGRGAPVGSAQPSANDPEVKAALKKALALANAIYKQMQAQKEAMSAVSDAKSVVAAWEEKKKEKEEKEEKEELPNADDLSMGFMEVRSTHLRRWGTSAP